MREYFVVGKYEIKRTFWYKGYVFLLSVVPTLTGTSAMWSTHKHEGEKISIAELAVLYQTAHDTQIDAMIVQEYLSEPQEFKIESEEDITQEQLNQLRKK